MRVLLVEDDFAAIRGMTLTLKTAGMVADQASGGEEALEMLRVYDYDIVVLDLMLPDIEGYEVVRRMRAARLATPVLILSGVAGAQARIKSLGVGADDHIAKPFERQEFVARIHAIVRRSRGFASSVLRVGNLELDLERREIAVNGEPIHLTCKEFAILELLMLRRNLVLTKEAFLNHLYGGMDEPEMKIIDVFICKLRKKLAKEGGDGLIGTVWGRGYVLREPVAAKPNVKLGALPYATPIAVPSSQGRPMAATP